MLRPLAALMVVAILALPACRAARRQGPSPRQARGAPSLRERVRDEARLVLEDHCGQCHISAYPTAVPRALLVFDLSETEWSARMSDAQLDGARIRLAEPLAPDGQANQVTDEERARFSRYVDAELARRATSAPSSRSAPGPEASARARAP
jgi:hypothetical protein